MERVVRTVWIIAVLMSICMTGCSGKKRSDFHVNVRDARSLAESSRVKWRGAYVGEVSGVEVIEDRVRIDVRLKPEYRGKIRHGVKASPSRWTFGRSETVLELYGGADSSMPVVERGSEIPEAGVMDLFSLERLLLPAVVLVVLLLVVIIAKGAKRIVAIVLALALLAFSVFFFKTQMDKYSRAAMGPELEARINATASKTLKSPEAVEIWDAISADVADAVGQIKDKSAETMKASSERVSAIFSDKAKEMKEQGKETVASDLADLRKAVEDMFRDKFKNASGQDES